MSAPMTPDREQEIRTLDLLELMSDRVAPVISGHLAVLLAEVDRLRAENDRLGNDLIGANLALWEDGREIDRLRLALKSAQRGRRELRAERDACHDWADTLAYKVAPVEVLGRHGEEGRYPWGDALDLITPAAEVDALEARHAAVLALHRKHSDSEHCFADDETWPCNTLTALGRTGDEPPQGDPEDVLTLRAANEQRRARLAELEARTSPATVLRQVADKWAAHCPEHSNAEDVWMDCPEDWVFELRRAADDRAEGGAL
ncbi:hypothetical protein ACH4MJ_04395 [Streptomyces anulatus]